jgi:hyaluronan synthase
MRNLKDRRGAREAGQQQDDPAYLNKVRLLGTRYKADFPVQMQTGGKNKKLTTARAVDISSTGILLEVPDPSLPDQIGRSCRLRFKIPPGTMPEGFESRVDQRAVMVRTFVRQEDGVEKTFIAFQFKKPLTEYFRKRRWSYSLFMSSGLMFLVVFVVLLMRTESLIYLKYHTSLYLYSIAAALLLLSRYFFGMLYREVPVNPDYTPGVSIVIPCFNEEKWIQKTIVNCLNQDYPIDKLEVIVVDDHSTDNSAEKIREIVDELHQKADRFKTKERLKAIFLEENRGKRFALIEGVKIAKHDLVVFVDSDSFLEPTAIKHLVQPFQDPKIGGVAGRTEVENKYTNALTKLQTVRYYIAFRVFKAAEAWFDSVTCLSGPLACYRKDLVLKYADQWINQRFLGYRATFGDDRSMTNFLLREHRVGYQDSAVCSTIVPSKVSVFLKQQMRWKRSWLRESIRATGFIWKKEPLMALFFYIGLVVPIAAPVVVLYNLVYVPLVHHVVPSTYLMGLTLMAAMMSLAHLFFKKSKLWLFGFVFVLFYEFVLLWQMPVAWVTFWKSTWGTRDTPRDVEAREKIAVRKKVAVRKQKKGIGLYQNDEKIKV